MAYVGYNQAKKDCNERYIKKNNLVQLKIVLPAEEKKKIMEAAEKAGESATRYILDAVAERMEREK